MPAAAVIPALIVYIKIAAVKKLVVGFRLGQDTLMVVHVFVMYFTCIL